MLYITKHIASIFFLCLILIGSVSESVANLTQAVECQVTMDCCTIDASPEHSCCCDIEESDNDTSTKKSNYLISKTFKLILFSSIIKSVLLTDEINDKIENEIIETTSNSPPKLIQNTISFIYYNSSLPRF